MENLLGNTLENLGNTHWEPRKSEKKSFPHPFSKSKLELHPNYNLDAIILLLKGTLPIPLFKGPTIFVASKTTYDFPISTQT
jgi:hypothetical protein